MNNKRPRKATCKKRETAAQPPARVPERPLIRDAAHSWLEQTNPLVGVSIKTAQAIFDCARQGDTQRLHWLYQEIEAKNPVLMTCIERRAAAIANYQWKITARPDADKSLGEEQQQAVKELIANIPNFTELLEHLDGAFFRGFALAQPVWNDDGSLDRIDLHDSWEFLKANGRLFWNPDCNGFSRSSVDCTDAGLIGIERTRAIDYPALAIHIRHSVGERDWGRFLERYALPKPAVTMAPNATNTQRSDYIAAARCVENGQVSVWPSGSSITDFAGGSRGTDPFSTFITHQEERIVLLSTGGTLTSLAQGDTGNLAGGAQMEVWKQIVGRDAGVLAQAVTTSIVRPFLERNFWGRPIAADFELSMPTKMTPQESANVAATLRQAGWRVKQDELERATGFTLEKEETNPASFGGFGGGTARKIIGTAKTPSQNDPKKKDRQGDGSAVDALTEAFARVLAESMAEEIDKLPTSERQERK